MFHGTVACGFGNWHLYPDGEVFWVVGVQEDGPNDLLRYVLYDGEASLTAFSVEDGPRSHIVGRVEGPVGEEPPDVHGIVLRVLPVRVAAGGKRELLSVPRGLQRLEAHGTSNDVTGPGLIELPEAPLLTVRPARQRLVHASVAPPVPLRSGSTVVGSRREGAGVGFEAGLGQPRQNLPARQVLARAVRFDEVRLIHAHFRRHLRRVTLLLRR
mmetsp:Transcript_1931/g.4143  ORF Transcript_1931/g.4143 Transcript_1931/m.4143 type:complete len:213 (-) Transcript_1931:734-1372(-)